jgi:hypothetical protein
MKITKLEEKTFGGKVTGHTVTLDNGVVGYLNDKDSDKVAQNDEVSYTIEVKQNKKGGNYNLLTLKRATGTTPPPPPPLPPPPNTPRPVSQAGIVQLKAQAASDAMRYVKDFFVADKITYDKFKDYFVELKGYLFDAIDEAAQ